MIEKQITKKDAQIITGRQDRHKNPNASDRTRLDILVRIPKSRTTTATLNPTVDSWVLKVVLSRGRRQLRDGRPDAGIGDDFLPGLFAGRSRRRGGRGRFPQPLGLVFSRIPFYDLWWH